VIPKRLRHDEQRMEGGVHALNGYPDSLVFPVKVLRHRRLRAHLIFREAILSSRNGSGR
jgi:hypothetical protein